MKVTVGKYFLFLKWNPSLKHLLLSFYYMENIHDWKKQLVSRKIKLIKARGDQFVENQTCYEMKSLL